MKVKELITLLQTMPQDLEVVDFSCERVEGCYVEEEFYDGDSNNPSCPIIKVVMLE